MGDDPAAVEDGDLVGETVGLLQVLGGQHDGGAVVDEAPDGVPHGGAARGVEPGGRLVEEDDGGVADRLIARSSRRRIPPENVRGGGRRRRRGRTWRAGPPRSGAGRRRGATRPSAPGSRGPSSTWSTAADCPVTLICSRTSAGCVATSNPATLAVPPSASISVARMLIVVVLPEPLAPSNANTVPRSTLNDASSSTRTPLNDLTRFRISIRVVTFHDPQEPPCRFGSDVRTATTSRFALTGGRRTGWLMIEEVTDRSLLVAALTP